jgi:hypothetical protein
VKTGVGRVTVFVDSSVEMPEAKFRIAQLDMEQAD